MQVIVFLDLDDTIFQTRHKCATGENLQTAAVDREGRPLSFMTESQRAFLRWLSHDAIVIPTTARSHDAFRRVQMSFQHAAILSFGAFILTPDGTFDNEWCDEVKPRLLAVREILQSVERDTLKEMKQSQVDIRVRLVHDADLPVYLVAKDSEGKIERLDPLHRLWEKWAATGQFFLHRNDNNLSLVPACVGKGKAVRYVLQKYFKEGPRLVIGMGDSLTDASFLAECEYVVIPRQSQIFEVIMKEHRSCSVEAILPKM